MQELKTLQHDGGTLSLKVGLDPDIGNHVIALTYTKGGSAESLYFTEIIWDTNRPDTPFQEMIAFHVPRINEALANRFGTDNGPNVPANIADFMNALRNAQFIVQDGAVVLVP